MLRDLGIFGKNGKLDEYKIQEYADYLKGLLPPNLLLALTHLRGCVFWNIVSALSNLHNVSSKKEAIFLSLEGNQRCNQNQKKKIRAHKPTLKVVRNMLTKKWIIIKKDKCWKDLMLQQCLNRYGQLLKKFMVVIRELAKVSEEEIEQTRDTQHNNQKQKML